MTVAISTVVVLAHAAWVLIRFAGMRLWHGAVCVLLGVYLDSTPIGGHRSCARHSDRSRRLDHRLTDEEEVPTMTDIPDAEADAVTALCSEIELLRARLMLTRARHANLLAAARASVAADADREPDPLFYLRDESAEAYEYGLTELDWYTAGDRYVVTDALGVPVHPEWYSDEFARLLRQASLPRIRLHDSRHTTLSLMEKAGVPISVISKWAGHYDSAFTMKTYVHASDDDLVTGSETLGRLYNLA